MASENVRDARTAGAVSGGLSGAGTGAAIGSSFSPVGTAIGTIIGAVSGAIGGAKKEEAEAKAREAEVKRLEQRENTAVQRQVLDSLSAGIDPRSQSDAPSGSPAASVAPQQFESVADNLSASGSNLSKSLSSRIQLETETATMLHNSWRSFVDDGYKSLAVTEQQLNTLLADERSVLELTNEQQQSAETAYNSSYSSAYDSLTTRSYTREEYDQVNTYVSELSSKDEKKRSRALTQLEHYLSYGGQLDVTGSITGLGASVSTHVENSDKSKDASEQTEEQDKRKQREDREDIEASTKKTYRFDKQTAEHISSVFAMQQRDNILSKLSSTYRTLDPGTKEKYRSARERLNNKMRLDYNRANTGFEDYVNRTFKHSRNFFRFLKDPFGSGSNDYLKGFNY